MTDIREQILARLYEILKGVVPDETFAFRNKIEIPEAKRPALVLLDQDEARDAEAMASAGPNRPSYAPVIMMMTPEIYVMVQEKEDDVGCELNSWRAKIIKAIANDQKLIALCKEIRYEGFAPALADGRAMEGQARVHFTFIYTLRIDQL